MDSQFHDYVQRNLNLEGTPIQTRQTQFSSFHFSGLESSLPNGSMEEKGDLKNILQF